MIGKTDLDLPWADHEAPDFRDWDQYVMTNAKPQYGIVEKIRRRDGSLLEIETNKVPLRDFDGRREVDERVRLQAEERQQRSYAEALRETAAAISGSLDLSAVLEEALVGAERLLSHDLGAVVLFDEHGEPDLAHYRARFGYGPSDTSTPLDLALVGHIGSNTTPPVAIEVGQTLQPTAYGRMREPSLLLR
jgi:hypothetical protein